jgi:hypothetical protein
MPALLETEDTFQIQLRAYWAIGLPWLSRRYTEALVKTGQEIP